MNVNWKHRMSVCAYLLNMQGCNEPAEWCLQLAKEHAAALEDMRSVIGTGLCFICKNRFLPSDSERYACKEFGEFREDHNPAICGKFEWRGAQKDEG